ncbi:MAG: TRAP transporter large permease subunit [Proteobacteria bacterium]|nr:TRAP transporter large permease subunit [Pseudomonadota bacterium]
MSVAITAGLVFLFILFFLFGAPLFTIIGGGAVLLFYLFAHQSMATPIVEMCRLANAPGIIAIPLFIFAGFIYAESKSSTRMINLSNAMLGWLPGGLTVAAVVVSTVFTAMTGASGVTIIAIGGILLPALIREGYSRSFSLGFIIAAGSSGVLFAPSLPIIIYGMIAKTNITELFLACLIPGLLIVGLLILYGIFYGARHHIPTTPFSKEVLIRATWEAKWLIPLPFFVVGGIYGGIITVSEAASVTVSYALFTECFIYQEIPFKKLFQLTVHSMVTVGALLLVLGAALGLTNFLVDQKIPQLIMTIISDHIGSKTAFVMVLNIFLLIVGCMMDMFSAIVVVVPLIAPVAETFNMDPIHLGVLFLANLELGYLTPPVGVNLFVASLRFNVSVMQLYRVVIPALIILFLALLIISYWPQLSLFLLDVTGQRMILLEI